MKTRIILFIITLTCFTGNLVAQKNNVYYRTEAFGSVASGNNTPFWILNHTWGMVPLDANNGYLRGGIFQDNKPGKNWSYSLGLDLAVSSPHVYNTFWIQQIYGALNWKSLRLTVGSREDYTSMLDSRMSSGDFTMSNNARPSPEIKVSIHDFTPIPDTEDMLYFKGDFAVGRYLDGDYQEKVTSPYRLDYMKKTLSHHKSVYFRIGSIEKKTRAQVSFGFDHHVQWGGELHRGTEPDPTIGVINLPHSFSDFIRTVFGREGGSNSMISDQMNVAGNQVGTYMVKADYKLKNESVLSMYWQHFFEDKSGLMLENAPDMLLGFQFKSKKKTLISGAVVEYFYTKDQSGPIHFNLSMDPKYAENAQYGYGMDNYYNNSDYSQGRSYFGRSMGNPLFLSPEYNEDGYLGFKSNRIFSLHTGIEGFINNKLEYLFLASYGNSLGRYDLPFIRQRNGVASAVDLTYHYPKASGLDFKFSFGFNSGSFYGDDAIGTAVTIRKTGSIFNN